MIILGGNAPEGKIRCPTCDTEFAYPLRREATAGGDDRDDANGHHTPDDQR